MEHASLDLSIVKKEPGFVEPFSSESGLFDNMMSDDFHDSNFHSLNHSNEEVPVDWLSRFFDDVPACADSSLSYNSLPEYTSSSLSCSTFGKSHYLNLNGLSMDSMPSFPEECANESLYCSPQSAPQTPDYKPLSPDSLGSSHSLEADVKPPLFCKDPIFDVQEGFTSQMNSYIEPENLKMFEQSEIRKSSPDSPHSVNDRDSDRLDSESGYDSGSHSPTSSSTTPPHVLEDNDVSVTQTGGTTPPVIQRPQEKQPFYLTEEERRTLVAEGLPVPSSLPLTKVEERALKKVRRKIKNKISAQESRRKKKEYMETLEKRVENCSCENLELRKKVDSLESTNRSLIGQLQKLQSIIAAKVPRTVTARSTQTSTCLMVVVLCFAVFLGSWSPLSTTGITLPSFSASASKGAVDYSTPSVRSRVLLSVVDELDSDEFIEYVPSSSIFDALNQLMPSAPAKGLEVDNDANSTISLETVAMETRKNESQLIASAA
ncbi:cyclic AMP-responsive element-binding protein 3-like protein 2 isoform X2 [Acropora millepora]|uniref:cyclic AMP-responsive element-binding protein 3-like protein 2 isoform X2 n=1 Tax=Acropora millepora TaxID=45264 RepID=UPI001CF3E1C0|nr:cyclic AMP-responsive element-binding protein 3-like protein 2 isoform X2 [Acropora millepora]